MVRSMVLYGSPIWPGDLMARCHSRETLRRVERRLAVRCIKGCRTTFHAEALALAGLIPYELQAEGGTTESSDKAANACRRTTSGPQEVVLSSLNRWLGRTHGGLTYHLAQVLTGYRCFGEYLSQIEKEATTQCRHCGGVYAGGGKSSEGS
ncbi:hypothetical protein WH47_06193 [Habropoda laboriosa]|uniref:Uncharacterized protein n=1 Tax=Habropoda laboriosa TaxID=597456 RepID=A0A0L7QTJ6_9HYME|nr:PREDICTED: uncharacterized protein LOC108575509 [Habropoda laboriosa]KOC61864.1 hypothetical protein WH47_06193 [Habropoda laboriosa]